MKPDTKAIRARAELEDRTARACGFKGSPNGAETIALCDRVEALEAALVGVVNAIGNDEDKLEAALRHARELLGGPF